MSGSEDFFDTIRRGDRGRLRALLEDKPALVGSVLPPGGVPGGAAGCTALHLAVSLDDVEAARILIGAGADPDARNEEGRTPLHDAIECGRAGTQRLLIQAGAEIDICSASILGRLERVRELLDAEPSLVNDRSTGLSPLGWASFGNQAQVAEELIARGAAMDDGELLCAASVGHVEVGRVLLRHGADPDAGSRSSGGALHTAVEMRYTCDSSGFVAMLLEAGADPHHKDHRGRTPLDLARAWQKIQQLKGPAALQGGFPREYARVVNLLREATSGESSDRGRPGECGPAGNAEPQ